MSKRQQLEDRQDAEQTVRCIGEWKERARGECSVARKALRDARVEASIHPRNDHCRLMLALAEARFDAASNAVDALMWREKWAGVLLGK